MYHTLNPENIKKIHLASCEVLAQIGMVIYHEEALWLLKSAGAEVRDGKKVFIPISLVDEAIKSAKSQITLYDRDENPVMILENGNIYYGTGSDTEALIDFITKERRKWRKNDVADAVRLCDYLNNIDFIMSMGMISDVDTEMNTREQYAIMVRNSKKPQIIGCYGVEDLKDVVRMAAAVRGGNENLREKPFFMLYCEPTSPLKHSFAALDKLLFAAENKIPTNYAPGGLAGATTPITAGGTLVLNNAECLLGLVVHQLKNPGAPFVYGFGNAPLNMWTMQPAYATPLAIQISGGMCDIARFYGLPSWGEAGNSSAKICDHQALMEASQFILMAALQGCNVIHDVGYLESGLSYSLEFLVICDEIIARTKDMVGEIRIVDEEYLAQSKIGIEEKNKKAHLKVEEILSTYHQEPLNKDVDEKIEAILAEARQQPGR